MKRREFLKSLVAVATAPTLPAVASAGASPHIPAFLGDREAITEGEIGYTGTIRVYHEPKPQVQPMTEGEPYPRHEPLGWKPMHVLRVGDKVQSRDGRHVYECVGLSPAEPSQYWSRNPA